MEIPKERKCTKCSISKPLTEEFFYPQKGYKYGLTRWCRQCRTDHSVELNREKRNEYRANWAREARGSEIDKYRAREFARDVKRFGTTIEWYRDKLIEQLGTCAICNHLSYRSGVMQRLQIDHNHACCDLKTRSCGKCLRGLLCTDCNMALSYLERFMSDISASPKLGKADSWTAKALRYIVQYEKKKEGR